MVGVDLLFFKMTYNIFCQSVNDLWRLNPRVNTDTDSSWQWWRNNTYPIRPLCCFWHYRSLPSFPHSWTQLWYQRHSTFMVHELSYKPHSVCHNRKLLIFIFFAIFLCPTGLSPRTHPFHHVHLASSHTHSITFHLRPSLCRWHTIVSIM